MVDVDVGDEEVAHIAELVADLPQRLGKPVPGRHQRDAGVDQVDAFGVGDRVDVDRPQPFHRQRQRNPVHASAQVLDIGLGPGVPVRRGVTHRVAYPFLAGPGLREPWATAK